MLYILGKIFYKNLAISYPRKLLTWYKKLVTLKFKSVLKDEIRILGKEYD